MKYAYYICLLFAVASLMATTTYQTAYAQDKETGWFFTGEFSFVQTAGNSEAGTLGLSGTLRRVWSRSELKLEGSGVQTESVIKTTTAVGDENNFDVREDKNREKTAEAYHGLIRYDYQVGPRFAVFGGVDWLRNRFAGIDSRFLLAAGAANIWSDTDKIRFKTDYGITYTFQDDVVSNPFIKSSFPGVRLAYDFDAKLTASTNFESDLTIDWNLENTDDVRIDFYNALPISISSKLALKPSIRLLWRNDPSLQELPLFSPDGTDTGKTVFAPFKKLDAFYNLTLVVKL